MLLFEVRYTPIGSLGNTHRAIALEMTEMPPRMGQMKMMAGPAKLAYGEVSGALVEPKANVELVQCVSKLLQPVVRDDAACLGEEGKVAIHKSDWFFFPIACIEIVRNAGESSLSRRSFGVFAHARAGKGTQARPVENCRIEVE